MGAREQMRMGAREQMGAREEQSELLEQSFVLMRSCKDGWSSILFGSPG